MIKKISLFVSTLTLATMLFGGALTPNTVHADIIQTPDQVAATVAEQNVGFKQVTADKANAKAATPNATGLDRAAANTANQELTAAKQGSADANQQVSSPAPASENCNVGSFFFGGGLGDCIIKAAGGFVLQLANLLLAMSGMIMNYVLVRTVFQFSTLIGNSPGLLIGWGILRDIGNIMVLFGFIYIGVCIMLDIKNYSVKKTLPLLLLFAVLLNFSLFVAEAVIDTSNVISSALYAQANTDPCQGPSITETATQSREDCATNYGLAGHIMQSTSLSTVFKDSAKPASPTALIGLAIFAIIGAIVFIAISVLLVIRAVVLTFVMVTSPIGFAGMALPQFKKFADQWWDYLLKEAFFAPVLLLMIFINLKIVDGFSKNGSLYDAVTTPNTSTVGVIFIFVIIIAFMLASLKAAKDIGSVGSGFVVKKANAALGTAKNAGLFVPRLAARESIGRGSQKLLKGYNQTATAKWLQSKPVFRNLDEGIAAGLSKGANAKFGGSKSFVAREKEIKDRKNQLESARKEGNEEARKKKQKDDLKKALAMDANTDAEKKTKEDAIAAVLEKMSASEVQELEQMKKSGESLELIAKNLSPQQFADIIKDGNTALTGDQKAAARAARFKDLQSDVDILKDSTRTADHAAAKARIKKYSAKDLQNANADLLGDSTLLENLSDKQRDDLVNSNSTGRVLTQRIKASDPVERIKAKAQSTDPALQGQAVSEFASNLDAKQVAKLPGSFLSQDAVADQLTTAMLKEINRENKITDPERTRIIARLALRRTNDPVLNKYLSSGAGRDTWT